ncbi:MAG: hypothetical protein Q4Q03_04720 [Bowdeniella nasicola]|nr:hypothetical protein [Bowdeniella nasicola]
MTWNTTDCVFFAAPERLRAALVANGVLAQLDYLPQPEREIVPVTVTIAIDQDNQLAEVRDGQVHRAGEAGERIAAIAEQIHASVWAPTLQLALDFDTPSPPADERFGQTVTAVITPTPLSSLPLYAEAVHSDLYVLDLSDRRVIITRTNGEANHYGFYGWDEESLPALVLSHSNAERLAVLHTSESIATGAWHSWDLRREFIPDRTHMSPAVRAVADSLFSRRADAELFARYANCDVEPIEDILAAPPERGLPEFFQAMDLPPILADVLAARVDPATLPGVYHFRPGSLIQALSSTVRLYLREEYPPQARHALIRNLPRLYLNNRPLQLAVAAAELAGATWLGVRAKQRHSTWRAVTAVGLALDAIGNVVFAPALAKFIEDDHIRDGVNDPDGTH